MEKKIVVCIGREGEEKEGFVLNKDEDWKLCKEWIKAKYEYLKNKADYFEEPRGYNLEIDSEESVRINGILINEEIFEKEKVDYRVSEREDQIDHLVMWISETDRKNDKELMLEDLKYLASLKDEFIFSSILTNEYIAKSQNEEEFNNICEEILKLNSELNKVDNQKDNSDYPYGDEE